ncbi:hydrolase [Campylobacter sp. MIT 99-7217]|uniref:cysteine hydrolase family protein n=1 Tax=Campylobacter sp. MIT 99-7217 TaxID=535091 RepID=UPI001159FC00|nr:isochorismatase family cysteine hydrolase [Campylobacter sp. MIT 99-7217]TQR30364.1 hydrolase [Campylobacter sp. MIT 99-7217]
MKKALIIVDYQNDFIDGSLGFEGALKIKDEILRLCKDFEGDLIFTLDTHKKDYLSTKEGLNLPVLHCQEGAMGHKMPAEFQSFLQRAKIFKKGSFGSLELANFLKDEGFDELHFAGLISHICVFHNIILAFNALPNAKIILHQNATASFDEALQNHAFELLKAFWVELR